MARRTRASSRAKSSTVSVNFKGVDTFKTIKDGDYRLVVDEVNQTVSDSKNDQLEFVFKIHEDEAEFAGQKVWLYCPLVDKALWKLAALLQALGEDVPDDEMDIDTEELVGKELMGVITNETYEGKKRSKLTDFYPIEADDEDDKPKGRGKKKPDADEEPKGKRGAKGKAKEPVKLDKEEVEGMDRDDLEALIEEHSLDVDADDFKKLPKLLAAILEELEEKDMLAEDEPKGKAKAGAKGKGKKLPKLSADEVKGMDEDELEEVVEKYELDVDLSASKTLRKKAGAVIDALDDADQLEADD